MRIFPVYMTATTEADIETSPNVSVIREPAERDAWIHQLVIFAIAVLKNLLLVVTEQLAERQGDESSDAVSKQVQPEGVLSRANPLLLQLQNRIHRVKHAVGLEEEGKAVFP